MVAVCRGFAWLAAGVAIVAFGGLTLRVLVVVIAIALCVRGVRRLFLLCERELGRYPIAAGAFGIASIVPAVGTALGGHHPRITAVVFGGPLIMSGVGDVRRPIRPGDREPSQSPSRVRRFAQTITALVAVAVAVVACVVSVNVRSDTLTSTTPTVHQAISWPSWVS